MTINPKSCPFECQPSGLPSIHTTLPYFIIYSTLLDNSFIYCSLLKIQTPPSSSSFSADDLSSHLTEEMSHFLRTCTSSHCHIYPPPCICAYIDLLPLLWVADTNVWTLRAPKVSPSLMYDPILLKDLFCMISFPSLLYKCHEYTDMLLSLPHLTVQLPPNFILYGKIPWKSCLCSNSSFPIISWAHLK